MTDRYLDIAREIATEAGQTAMTHFGRRLDIRHKGVIDLVTEADLAVEQAILDRLRRAFPDHGFLTEENGRQAADREFVWVVDPIDGTTNFAHGYPLFCVSIALRHRGETIVGVVNAPAMGEMFTATRHTGARLNGDPIRVSERKTLVDSLLTTGFPYNIREESTDVITDLHRFMVRAQGIRRDGSAALDLCYVAMGRFDGFWERRLHPWDTAAGALIVTEAGGRVTRFDGGAHSIFDREILASNGHIHEAMMAVLAGRD